MRFAPVLALSLVGLVAACAGASEDTDTSDSALASKGEESIAYGDCGYTRAELIRQVSAARGDAITRGFEWYDARVPFNMSAKRDGYRTDCSGFVSMCWQLGAPGQNTTALATSGSGTTTLSSYDDLVPADAFVWAGHHSMIFLGWNDSAHKGACVLEQASTASDMKFRVRLSASLKASGFVAVRSDNFANDVQYTPASRGGSNSSASGNGTGTPVGTGTPGSTGSGTPTGSTGSSTSSGNDNGSSCKPSTAAVACKDAYENRGVQCGKVSDGCGGAVDCIVAYPQGCGADPGVICQANKCVDTVCRPKTGAAACAAAKAECGTATDGCGGTVNCDDVAGYGCASNETCSSNKCYAPGAVPADAGTTSTTTGASTTTNPEGDLTPASDGDQGDDAPSTADTSETRTPRALSSSGCNAAPGTGMDLAPLAGLALVLAGLRRRNKKNAA